MTEQLEVDGKPRVIENVSDDALHSLLAELAQRGAWVLAMDVNRGTYRIEISWNSPADRRTNIKPADGYAPAIG